MGTWGNKLLDNDHAWDVLSNLTKLPKHSGKGGLAQLEKWAVQMYLHALFPPPKDMDQLDEGIIDVATSLMVKLAKKNRDDDVEGTTREALDAWRSGDPMPPSLEAEGLHLKVLAADRDLRNEQPFTMLEPWTGSGWGPPLPSLLEIKKGREKVSAFGTRAVRKLDTLFRNPKGSFEDYDFTGLVIVAALRALGFIEEAPNVQGWREGFQNINEKTESERHFWGGFVQNVEALFLVIENPNEKPSLAVIEQAGEQANDHTRYAQLMATTSASPLPYSPRTEYGVGSIIEHSKFGTGVVAELKEGNKIEVVFLEDARVLVHRRG